MTWVSLQFVNVAFPDVVTHVCLQFVNVAFPDLARRGDTGLSAVIYCGFSRLSQTW